MMMVNTSTARYLGMSVVRIDTKPTIPAAPRECVRRSSRDTRMPPIPAAPIPMKKGQRSRRLTPKMAGSVIPKSAETPPAPASPFILASRVLRNTARATAPCATLAMEAIGKMKDPPVLALSAMSGSSTAGKDW